MCTSVSCNPYTNELNGLLIVEEKAENLPFWSPIVCVLGSTILYPFVAAISALSYLYFSSVAEDHKREVQSHQGALTEILTLPANDLQAKKVRRVAELVASRDLLQTHLLRKMPEYADTVQTSDFTAVKNQYAQARESGQIVESAFPTLFEDSLVIKIKLIRAFQSAQQELTRLTSGEIESRAFFELKERAAICRHQIQQQVAEHKCKLLAQGMMPLIGLYLSFFTGDSTKQAVEENLVNHHNDLITVDPWLQTI